MLEPDLAEVGDPAGASDPIEASDSTETGDPVEAGELIEAGEPIEGADPPTPRYVIHVSVDGLRPEAVVQLGTEGVSALSWLRAEGASTDNARTDADYRVTLPNHASQLTGRPVLGPQGHGWARNTDPGAEATLHSHRGHYVASAFDVAHDRGLRTAAYVSKSKFTIFDRSFDGVHGAADTVGVDDGRDKIDTFVFETNTERLVRRVVADLMIAPHHYTFVHLRNPDSVGHADGWNLDPQSEYMQAVRRVDDLIGAMLDAVRSDAHFAKRTTIIVTADHGGSGYHHREDVPAHYTIPFYVWGAGVARGDLYDLNAKTLADPGDGHPGMADGIQPVRNGAAANLALSLLGLPPVPGSTINTATPLRVRPAL